MPISGHEDPDPKEPSAKEDPDQMTAGVDVNEATFSDPKTLGGDEALAETRERHREMAEVDEAERS